MELYESRKETRSICLMAWLGGGKYNVVIVVVDWDFVITNTSYISLNVSILNENIKTINWLVKSLFERELALLDALKGESFWKGGSAVAGDVH